MPRTTFSPLTSWSTDAAFRTWGLSISNSFAAAGLVKQTHTNNMINWATALKPTAGWTYTAGWEVWAFNDALQGTAPIYLHVYYGCTGNTTYPLLTIYTSFAYDSVTGNYSGNYMGAQVLVSDPYGAVTARMAGDGSGIVGDFYHAAGNRGFWGFVCERTRDAAGNIDSRGVYFLRLAEFGVPANNWSCFIPRTGTQFAAYSGINSVPPLTGTGSDGANISVYPVRVMCLQEQSPVTLVMAYTYADLAPGQEVQLTRWDSLSRTYFPVERRIDAPGYAPGSATGTLIYWEP